MSDKYGVGQDPYCFPGTQVLKNRIGLKDDATLERAETEIAATALRDIQFSSPPYDFNYFKTIHRQLFGSLYVWASNCRCQKGLYCYNYWLGPNQKRTI